MITLTEGITKDDLFKLNDLFALPLIRGLSFHQMRGSDLGDQITTFVATLLSENRPLVSLKLYCHIWCDKRVEKALAQALLVNTTLKVLDLKWNYMPNDHFLTFAQTIAENKTLKVLDLSGNGIEAEGAPGVSHFILLNQSITRLILDYNELFNSSNTFSNILVQCKKQFAVALSVNKTLTEISLRGCFFRDNGTVELAQALRVNPTLRRLNLSYNVITDKGALALASAFKENPHLESVDLSDNQIEDNGISAIAKSLHGKTSLIRLLFNTNRFTDFGGTKIADFSSWPKLTTLELSDNQLTEPTAKSLGVALETHTSLTILNLYRTRIADAGASHIAKALILNSSLLTLRLGWSVIEKSIEDIASALILNKTLTSLDLSFNNISNVKSLNDALKANKSLLKVDLSHNKISEQEIDTFEAMSKIQNLKWLMSGY